MWELVPIVAFGLFIAFLSDFFSKKDNKLNGYIKKEKFLWILIVLSMAVFAGLRIKYNDTSTYLESYIYLQESTIDFNEFDWSLGSNPGFNLLNTLLKHYKFSANGYFMVYSLITYGIYIWFIHKYSTDFLMSMFIFICFVFTFPLAAIKQCVAIAFCLIAVDRAINKKWFWFVFWVFIAETFHAYSFLYLLVPMLFFLPWESNKTYVWIVIFFFTGLLLKPLLGTVLSITDSLGDNYSVEEFSGEGVNPFRLAVCLVPLVLSFILRNKVTDPKYEMMREDNICMNLSFLNGEIMFVALFGTANYFARLANYFYIFPVIALPRLFNMVQPKWRIPLKLAVVVCYFMYFYYSNIIAGWRPFDEEFSRIALSEFHFFE